MIVHSLITLQVLLHNSFDFDSDFVFRFFFPTSDVVIWLLSPDSSVTIRFLWYLQGSQHVLQEISFMVSLIAPSCLLFLMILVASFHGLVDTCNVQQSIPWEKFRVLLTAVSSLRKGQLDLMFPGFWTSHPLGMQNLVWKLFNRRSFVDSFSSAELVHILRIKLKLYECRFPSLVI